MADLLPNMNKRHCWRCKDCGQRFTTRKMLFGKVKCPECGSEDLASDLRGELLNPDNYRKY